MDTAEGLVGQTPEPPQSRTIGELVLALREAYGKMGAGNPHKSLIGQCAFALVYLAQENEHLKSLVPRDTPEKRIVLASEIGRA